MVVNRTKDAGRVPIIVATLVVVTLLSGAAACGSSNKTETGGSDPPIPAVTTPTTGQSDTTVAGIDPMDGADTTTKSGAGTGQGVALLTDVQVARHEGYDRVVFTFSNHVPGYQVGYIAKPVKADGSGDDVTVAGSFVVGVRMNPASGVDMSATSEPQGYKQTYLGPKRINAGTPEVTEVVESGDFEAVLNWAIGTQDKVNFRVLVLTNPARLVVDLQNH